MTMKEYYEKHGVSGLMALAEASGTKLSYLRQLIYSTNKNPSIRMAITLVESSGGELTFDGLAFPLGRNP